MTTLSKQELRAKITELELKIKNNSNSFTGEIGDFQWFLKQGIAKELYSMTTPEYKDTKPNLSEFKDIMYNITVLYDIFDLITKRDELELNYDKLCN